MLGTSSTAAATLSTSTSSATSPSTSRPGRLRGLSYLRNYTHLHHSSASSRSTPSPLTRSHTAPEHPQTVRPSSPAGDRDRDRDRDGAVPSPQRSTTSAGNPTSGWVPTVGGQSGISRLATAPQATPTDSSGGESRNSMTRNRAETVVERGSSGMADDSPRVQSTTRSRSAEPGNVLTPDEPDQKAQSPTIRMIPHHDARSSRPSLTFPIINRTLPTGDAVVRVGRYSERDNQAANLENDPSATAPVGFKSKVVSRRHCEFWCSNNQWFVKDVKSSSGTFLNHVRLSAAGTESKPYPVNDGDIVQLGIDFKGGEEIIFRCVKIRIECNRSWQKALNSFNTSTHKRLRNLTSASRKRDSDAASVSTSECSICLNRVAPCQALFVAPCSHVWHYKCIRSLLFSQYPAFQCPNCRGYADLEADVEDEDDSESDTQLSAAIRASEEAEPEGESSAAAAELMINSDRRPSQLQHSSTRQTLFAQSTSDGDGDDELSSAMAGTSLQDARHSRARSHSDHSSRVAPPSTSEPVPIPTTVDSRMPDLLDQPQDPIGARSATPTSNAPFALAAELLTPSSTGGVDGLSTPRNEAGPYVLDSGIDHVVSTPLRSARRFNGAGAGGDDNVVNDDLD